VNPVLLLLLAGSSTGIPVDRFVPGTGPSVLLGAEAADVTALGQGSLALSLGYLRDPIQLALPSGELLSQPVRQQLSTDVSAEAGIFRRRIAIGVGLPVVWWQRGDRLQKTGIDEAPLASPVGGDMRFRAKAALRATGIFHLALLLTVTAPLGGQHHFAATDGVTVEPRLIADVHLGRVFVAAGLGVRFAPERQLFLTHFGDELTWVLGVGVAAWRGKKAHLALMAEGAGAVGAEPGTRPVELRGALRFGWGTFSVDAGAGGGVIAEVGAPAWRLFLVARLLVGRPR
jgi:hypothetical protein